MQRTAIFYLLVLCLSLLAGARGYAETLVGTLHTGSQLVEVYTSEGEPRYTVMENGHAIVQLVTEEELATRLPEVHQLVKRGIARDASLSRELVVPPRFE